jgi:hypothetical protein
MVKLDPEEPRKKKIRGPKEMVVEDESSKMRKKEKEKKKL